MRSGRYIQQIEGYSAFIPAPLPPKPSIQMDTELNRLLSNADRALGRLDGATSILPNPDLFVAMYVRQEAVLSSQIEGTQSTLEDIFQYEIDARGQERFKDVQEVVNYVNAMNYGLKRLQKLPLCLRLLREILQKPLLYLSHSLKIHRLEYYDRLMAIRTTGDWEGWLKFFLQGIFEVSQSATTTARSILEMREKHREVIGQQISSSSYGLRLLDLLFQHPIVSIRFVENELQCTYATASKIVEKFVEVGLLNEITGWQRNRLYRYEPYLNLFENSYSLVNPDDRDSIPSTQSE